MLTSTTLLFVVCAFVVGFVAGRIFPLFRHQEEDDKPSADYFQGLDDLLNEQTDEAMEHFLKALQLNSDRIEVPIALGKLFCRRGEVDQAIHTHQQLLARTGLTNEQNAQVMLALAQDYTRAGLLDRAETLLMDISQGNTSHKWPALQALISVYEKEKEWHKAIEAGDKLTNRSKTDIATCLAHYCCELATAHIKRADFKQARADINRAFRYDRNCVRASLLLGELAQYHKQPREAIKALQKVQAQDARFVSETFGLLEHCFTALGNVKGFAQWLMKAHQQQSSVASMLSMAQLLMQNDSPEAASEFLQQQLLTIPSLQGVVTLLELHAMMPNQASSTVLSQFSPVLQALLRQESAYQCVTCGFLSQKLHWQCPSCGGWGKTVPRA